MDFFFMEGVQHMLKMHSFSPWRASGIVSARFCLVAVSTLHVK